MKRSMPRSHDDVLVIIPCLNEEAHLASLLDEIVADVPDALVVVVDGGSRDRSRDIALDAARQFRNIVLLDNPARIQSAALNLAVERFGASKRWLARIDAHCGYPARYVSGLVEVGERMKVASVTVPMRTVGSSCFQRSVAAAQNSKLGTGGSAHRMPKAGCFVDHGHHALMRIDAFRAAGGYCEAMSHNEDAELDVRIRKGGGRIWLEPVLTIEYFPRSNGAALARQYHGYGRGRAQTIRRHSTRLRARQALPIFVAPAVALAALTPLWWQAALPAGIWLALCVLWGGALGIAHRSWCSALSGGAAAIMHISWSAGFWRGLLARSESGWQAALRFQSPQDQRFDLGTVDRL